MNPDISTGQAAIGIVLMVFGVLAMLMRLRAALWIIGAMFMASALSVGITYSGMIWRQWLFPVQELRSEIFLLAGTTLAVGLILYVRELDIRRIGTQAWILFIMGLFQGTLRIHHDGAYSGFSTLIGTFFTLFPIMLAIPLLLRKTDDVYALFRLMLWVHVVYLLGCVIQLTVNPSRLVIDWNDRFLGLTGQTQHTAVYLAIVSVIGLWVLLNDPVRRYRTLWILTYGISVILLMGTGSRTGLGVFVIGTTAVLYRRLGRMVFFLPFGVLAIYVGYRLVLLTGLDMPFERVLSLKDTRSNAWALLISEIRRNPMFGTGLVNLGASENSYLRGWAAFGSGYMLLLVIFIMTSISVCFRLWWQRTSKKTLAPIIDLIIGFNAMYFAGAMFEGYILGRSNSMLVTMLIMSGVAAFVIHDMAIEEEEIEEVEFPCESFEVTSLESGEAYGV